MRRPWRPAAMAALLGRPAVEFVTAFRSDRGAALLQSVYDGHAQRFEHDDLVEGKRLRLESHLKPDLDSQGRVRGVFVIGVDITALSRQTVTLNAIIESIPAMVAVVDQQLRYRLVLNRQVSPAVRSVDDRGFGADDDRLGDRTDPQCDRQVEVLRGQKSRVGFGFGKARGFDRDLVIAGSKADEAVVAGSIGGGDSRDRGRGVQQRDSCFRDTGAARVLNHALDTGGELCEGGSGE